MDCAKTIVGTRRENYKGVQLSATRDTLTLFDVSDCTKLLKVPIGDVGSSITHVVYFLCTNDKLRLKMVRVARIVSQYRIYIVNRSLPINIVMIFVL